jgi:hypothetical protein
MNTVKKAAILLVHFPSLNISSGHAQVPDWIAGWVGPLVFFTLEFKTQEICPRPQWSIHSITV